MIIEIVVKALLAIAAWCILICALGLVLSLSLCSSIGQSAWLLTRRMRVRLLSGAPDQTPEEKSLDWLTTRVENLGGRVIKNKDGEVDRLEFTRRTPTHPRRRRVSIYFNRVQVPFANVCLDPNIRRSIHQPLPHHDLWLGLLYTVLTTAGCVSKGLKCGCHRCGVVTYAKEVILHV